jgi:4-amino-4-deoxy-L-arabinose transferase-like glycosyltransferase
MPQSRSPLPRAVGVLLLIGVAALAVRVGYIAVAKRGEPPLGDAVYYNAQANVLADGRGFADALDGQPTAEHPPMTALVLTPVSWVVKQFAPKSDRVMAQRLTMAVLGAGVVVVIGLVGRAVAGDRAGYLAAGIAAVYPNLWVNDGLVMSETLAALAVALAILLAYRLARQPTMWNALWLGLACGAAMLVRAELALLLPVMVVPLVWWLRELSASRRLRVLGVTVVVSALTAALWVVPNLVRFDEPTFFSTNDGLTLCGANVDSVYYGRGIGLWSLECAFSETPKGDRSVRSNALRKQAFEYIGHHTKRVPLVVLARVGRVWSVYDPSAMVTYNVYEGRERAVSWLGFATFWLLVPFAGYGAILLRRRRVRLTPLLAQLIVVTVTAAAIYGLVRFRVPAEISIVVLAGVAVDHLLPRRSPADVVGGAASGVASGAGGAPADRQAAERRTVMQSPR